MRYELAEMNTGDFLMWIGTFSDSEDRCYSATGNFYYANDRIRFVMPIHVLPYLEENGPNKNDGGSSSEGFTEGDRRFAEALLSPYCKYVVTIEKLVKVDGEYQMVPTRR